MNYLISISLILAGIIHILPLSGVLSHNQLKQLYGIDFSEPNLAILMRHRAVLFGLLGCFLLWAAFDHAWQILAFIAGFVSILSFIYFAHSVGNYNEKIRRVVMADLIALLALLLGSVSYIFVYH